MLPVIQLHQETRCQISRTHATEPWQIAWALYSMIGKLITSLALLTYSGVLKPRDAWRGCYARSTSSIA